MDPEGIQVSVICEKVKFVLILYKSKLCFFQGCILNSTYLYSLVIITISVKYTFFSQTRKHFIALFWRYVWVWLSKFCNRNIRCHNEVPNLSWKWLLKMSARKKKTQKILTNVDVATRTLHAKQRQKKMIGFVYKPVIIPPCSNCRIYSHGVLQCTGR